MERGAVSVSIVVPTRNESENAASLIRRLRKALRGVTAEILFVDDSDDGTPREIQSAARSGAGQGLPIRCIHREPGARPGGLAGAVLTGLRAVVGDVVVIMDGDLQHPPELIPTLLAKLAEANTDIVVASRYVSGAQSSGLGTRRRAVTSRAATKAARLLFPIRLRSVSDPMSGFFAVRLAALNLDQSRPVGFKILMELLVRTPAACIAEVGFTFGKRCGNRSKAGVREGLRFARHLVGLRLSTLLPARITRMVAFGSVGLAGVAVNTLAMALFLRLAGINYLVAAALATQVSTTFNFLGAELWVFRGRKERTGWGRYWRFSLMNNAAMVARLPLLAFLVRKGTDELAANAATLIIVFIVRFMVSDRFIYGSKGMGKGGRTVERVGPVLLSTATATDTPTRVRKHAYRIHGILSIASEVALPELEGFRTPDILSGAPDIDVRVAKLGRVRRRAQLHRSADGRTMEWEEHLGGLGANFNINFGDPVEVTASPALAASPHVLYTNVIEALLRFMLVDRGYMLLHSACLEINNRGIMLSARTDTGKTGTILKLLRNHGGWFLSDDMTVIDANGVALSFPKPLTISHHTLRAIEAGYLSPSEWRRLKVQSRVHSKEGRGFAMKLAQLNLPILTINGIMQRVVPPPKYGVQRLVKCAMTDRTQVRDLFIIERGAAAAEPVDHEQALTELLENTEDAYGFPPYRYLAPAIVLGERTSADLLARERAILTSALRNIRVHRCRSDNFRWADMIAEHLVRNVSVDPDDILGAPVSRTTPTEQADQGSPRG
jgi:dolichol-phosphate mannosyltransferase